MNFLELPAIFDDNAVIPITIQLEMLVSIVPNSADPLNSSMALSDRSVLVVPIIYPSLIKILKERGYAIDQLPYAYPKLPVNNGVS